MAGRKPTALWIVNVVSFIFFVFLCLTGLINWFILPRGSGGRGGILASMRHFSIEVHEWTAVLFMMVIVLHLLLHWSYIKANLKKRGVRK